MVTGEMSGTATTATAQPAPSARQSAIRAIRSHAAGRLGARRPRFTVRALDLQVLTWWVLTRVSILVISVSGPMLVGPQEGAPSYFDRWFNWDVVHFDEIAQNGYFNPAHETPVEAFFPGLSMLMRLGLVAGLPTVLTGLLVSFVFGGVAAVALGRLAEDEFGEGAGTKAALAWMLAPPAVFLAAPYTESLFLGLAVPAWLAAKRGHWWLAGILAACACTVRVSGVFLVIALLVEFAVSKKRGGWENIAWLTLPALPLAGYMGYLWQATGRPLAWYDAQAEGWYREFTMPWEALRTTWDAARHAAFGSDQFSEGQIQAFQWMFHAELIAILVGVVLTIVLLTTKRWGEATWVGIQVVAFSTSGWFFSVPRATLLWFPLWIGLGALALSRPWIWRAYLVIAAPLCGLWAAAYFLGLNYRWTG